MLKNISRLECKIEDRIYQFTCDMESPLNHVKEVLFQFSKYVGQMEDNIKAKQESEKNEKDKIEEPSSLQEPKTE